MCQSRSKRTLAARVLVCNYGKQLQFYIKRIYYNFFTNLLYQFLVLFVIISRRFSCKLEKCNEMPLKKHLLRICTWLKAVDYGNL